MFASNFPMDKCTVPYTVLWNAYKRMTAHLPIEHRRKLFHDNAVRFYRLEAGRVAWNTPVDLVSGAAWYAGDKFAS
jgi:hypothetical protein